MKKVVMYTGNPCPYCVYARALLDSKKVPYQEINPSIRNFLSLPPQPLNIRPIERGNITMSVKQHQSCFCLSPLPSLHSNKSPTGGKMIQPN